MEHDSTPWGQFWILEDKSQHKIRRMAVHPRAHLTYLYQDQRDIWILFAAGKAQITSNGMTKEYQEGDSAIIPKGVSLSIENLLAEPLIYIEVQHGTYFGDADIVRIEDN